MVKKATELFDQLNQLSGIKINSFKEGSKCFDLQVDQHVNIAKLRETLGKQYKIFIPNFRGNSNPVKIMVNETLLKRDNQQIVEAFKKNWPALPRSLARKSMV